MKKTSTLTDLALLVVLAGVYGLLYSHNIIWDWLRSIASGSLLIVGLGVLPLLIGAIIYATLGRKFSYPPVYIPLVSIISYVAITSWILVTYEGPRDHLGIWPYLIKLFESLMVLLGATSIALLGYNQSKSSNKSLENDAL